MLRLLLPGPKAEAYAEARSDPLRPIAAAAARGNRAAQRTLLTETGSASLRTVRAVLGNSSPDVEDVFQEATIAVLGALPGFRGECSVLHFVCRIAVQTAMNARRRGHTRTRYLSSADHGELTELARDEISPAETLAAARRRSELQRLLGELPEPQAEVLALHTMLGYTVEETAQVTRVPVNTVRSRLRAGLVALRQALADGKRLEIVRGAP